MSARRLWERFWDWVEGPISDEDKKKIAEWDEMPGVENTGSIVATPEDWADIRGPADPVRVPKQRRRHAREEGT